MRNRQLWKQLQQYDLNRPEATFRFSDRLARENGWSPNFTSRVIEEYKKFMYLVATTSTACTPSDEVDQAWHLHLIYSESYQRFCLAVFGYMIHHGPTAGGGQERRRYTDQYAETLGAYRREFGAEAPRDIWPENEIRFGRIEFVRVSRDDNWIIPRNLPRRMVTGLLAVGALFFGIQGCDFVRPGEVLLLLIPALLIAGWYFVRQANKPAPISRQTHRAQRRRAMRKKSRERGDVAAGCGAGMNPAALYGSQSDVDAGSDSDSGSSGDSGGASGCGSGCGGCGG